MSGSSTGVTGHPSRAFSIGALLCAAALVVAQQTLRLGHQDLLGYALNDAMHVPLFAVLTVLLCWAFAGRPLALVVAGVLLLAVTTEAVQLVTGRDASLIDLGHDAAGIACGALGVWSARRLARLGVPRRATLLLWAGVACVVLAVAALRPAQIWLAKAAAARAFPTLLRPEAGLDGPLVATRSRWRVVPAPPPWQDMAGRPVIEVVWAAQRYPDIVLLEVAPNWDGFEQLVADVMVPGGAPIIFTARVHYPEAQGASSWSWRSVPPGAHRVRFPLDELLLPGHGGIGRLVLHVGNQDAGRTMLLGPVWLQARPGAPGPGSRQGR